MAHVDHGIHPDSAPRRHWFGTRAPGLGLPFVSAAARARSGARARPGRGGERYRWLRAERRRLGARWIADCAPRRRSARDGSDAPAAGLGTRRSGWHAAAGPGHRCVRCSVSRGRSLVATLARRAASPGGTIPRIRIRRHLRSWMRRACCPFLRRRLPDLDRRLAADPAPRRRRPAGLGRSAPGLAGAGSPRRTARGRRSGLAGARGPARRLAERIVAEALVAGPAAPARARLVSAGAARAARTRRAGPAPTSGRWRLELAFGRLRIVPPTPPSRDAGRPVEPSSRWVIDHPPARPPGEPGASAGAVEPAPRASPATVRPRGSSREHWRSGAGARATGWRPSGARGAGWRCAASRTRGVPRSERRSWPMIEGRGGAGMDSRGLPVRAGSSPSRERSGLRVDVESRG